MTDTKNRPDDSEEQEHETDAASSKAKRGREDKKTDEDGGEGDDGGDDDKRESFRDWLKRPRSKIIVAVVLLAVVGAIGLTGGMSQLFMTGSLGLARISVIAPFDYSQLVWAVLLGWAIWNTAPNAQTWLGAGVIAACGVYSAYRERKLRRDASVAG